MTDIITEQLCFFLELTVTSTFFIKVLIPKRKVIYTYLFFLLYYITGSALTFTFRSIAHLRGPIIIILELATVMLAFRDKISKKLISFIGLLAIQFLCEALSIVFYRIFSGSWSPTYNTVERQLCSILNVLFYSFLAMLGMALIKRTRAAKFLTLGATQLLLIISQTSFISLIYFASSSISSRGLMLLEITAVVPAVIVNLYFSEAIEAISRISIKELELEYAEKKSKQEYSYYQLALENDSRLSALRHDMSNTIQAAYAMLEAGEAENSMKLIREFNAAKSKAESIVYCNNKVINTVLSVKSREMRSSGIACDISVLLSENELPLTELELMSVLTNLLDNAIEACEKSKDGKAVSVLITENQGFLVIRVDNDAVTDAIVSDSNVPFTTKDDKALHGYGIKNIRSCVKAHDGQFAIKSDGDRVTAIATFRYN